MYYRHRYTDPFTGRFLQQDPLGLIFEFDSLSPALQYSDDRNLYQYVTGNPLIFKDPEGLRGPIEPIDPDFFDFRECSLKRKAYAVAADLLHGSPFYDLLNDWYYERESNPRYFFGSNKYNNAIRDNSGFKVLLEAWVAEQFNAALIRDNPHYKVNRNGIFWHYYFPVTHAGGLAAYTKATLFLGSYSADLSWSYSKNCNVNVRARVKNETSWVSASRTLNLFGGKWANLENSNREDMSRTCPHGGNFTQYYIFQVNNIPINPNCELCYYARWRP
jgi:RHS repeat-associated protein